MSKPPLPGQGKKSAPAAPGGVALDERLVLELTGEADVGEVRELVARGHNITSVDMASLGKHSWHKLEALSLSQNKIGATGVEVWEWLQKCASLRSLNLNFCEMTTLAGVEHLAALESLYLSSNKISDLAPLKSCRQLKTLSLYRNTIQDLDACVAALRELPELRELELSGNPVWFKPECKHRCVLELPALARYDDEELAELDRELAEDFATAGGIPAPAAGLRGRPATAPLKRGSGGGGGSPPAADAGAAVLS
eukprot:SAG22_NODE_4624_length_1212_cov_8.565139_1_plen_253_part_01